MNLNTPLFAIVFFGLFLSFNAIAQDNGTKIKPDEEVYTPEQLKMMKEIKSIIRDNKHSFLKSLTKEQKSRYDEIQKLKALGVNYKIIDKTNTAFMNTLSEAQHKSRQEGIDKRDALKKAFRASLNEEQREHQTLKRKLWLNKTRS